MSPLGAGKAALLVFAAVILQTAIVSSLDVRGGAPDLVLVVLVAVALLHGSVAGAAAGFAAGLLLDTATLATLGVSSLLLTVAGYWAGRYGETTGRDRGHAPVAAVFTVTVLATFAGFALHVLIGDAVSARHVFLEALLPTVVLNVLLAVPVFALVRRLVPATQRAERAREVQLLV
jgi:rod shape-determining protein MreD